jgi:hypothetical protein
MPSPYLQPLQQLIEQKPPLTPEQAQELKAIIEPLNTEQALGNAVAEWCLKNDIIPKADPHNGAMRGPAGAQPQDNEEVQQAKKDLINTLNTYTDSAKEETNNTNDRTQ